MMYTWEQRKDITKNYIKDIDRLAKETAEAVNGGSWETDYTDSQKEGWRLMVIYVVADVSDMFAM